MLLKLEKWVFYLFIFALPFQTRIILKSWGSSFNEWNAAFLYGTDILLAALFVFWFIRTTTRGRRGAVFVLDTKTKTSTPTSPSRFLLFFIIICTLSLLVADNFDLGFYRLIKILEFVGLYYYIRSSLGNQVSKLGDSFLVVALSGFFQAIIAIGQSLLQHSLGLKWLGESILRTNFNAVAVVAAEGERFLRAYGTTPHPNILAAWLFLGIFAFYYWYLYHGKNKQSKGEDWSNQQYTHLKTPERGVEGRRWVGIADLARASQDLFVFLIYPLLLWGLFATFSRVVLGLWLAGILARFLIILIKKEKYRLDLIFKKRLKWLFVTTLVVIAVFCFSYWSQVQSRIFISGQEQAVSQRILYAKMAGEIASDQPWLGVGLGQLVGTLQSSFKNYPNYFYQPVHNIYLLILSEVGFLGLGFFVAWLYLLSLEYYQRTGFKRLYQFSFFIVFISILTMGFFDHFLWTLQQGQLIFWITAGLVSVSDYFKNMQ